MKISRNQDLDINLRLKWYTQLHLCPAPCGQEHCIVESPSCQFLADHVTQNQPVIPHLITDTYFQYHQLVFALLLDQELVD